MKYSTLSIAAVAFSATTAFAGGPDHMAPMPHWHMVANLLAGVAHNTAHGKNHTAGNPGPYTQPSFNGTGGQMLVQAGAAYKRYELGMSFDLNEAETKGGANLAGQSQDIDYFHSIGIYGAYTFMKAYHSMLSVLGSLSATEWNVNLREVARNNNTTERSLMGVSETVGLRYGHNVCHNLKFLAQLSTSFHQLNSKVITSNEFLTFHGNAAVTSSFLAGFQYQFNM